MTTNKLQHCGQKESLRYGLQSLPLGSQSWTSFSWDDRSVDKRAGSGQLPCLGPGLRELALNGCARCALLAGRRVLRTRVHKYHTASNVACVVGWLYISSQSTLCSRLPFSYKCCAPTLRCRAMPSPVVKQDCMMDWNALLIGRLHCQFSNLK